MSYAPKEAGKGAKGPALFLMITIVIIVSCVLTCIKRKLFR